MKTPLVHISCLVFLPLLLSPTARHASGSPIDWTNSCRPLDAGHWEADHPGPPAARSLAASAAAPARTVRLIYFIPNDRTFDSDVVDSIKVRIPRIQTFFRDQMETHGHGPRTFQYETDDQGDPVVHRVDAPDSDDSYLRSYRTVGVGNVLRDLRPAFDAGNSILLIVVDHSTYNNLGWGNVAGFGGRWGKNSGYALLPASFLDATAAHELGHAFGLQHDFNDGANIMSYGPGWNRLSGCSAGFLAVHPYFDPDVPIEDQQTWDLLAPTVELASPLRYAAGSTSLSLQLRVRASGGRGLQQALFFLRSRAPHPAAGSFEVKACGDLRGAQDTVVAFSHDGVVPSAGSGSLSDSPAHFVSVHAVDSEGNANSGPYRDAHFVLAEDSPHHLATLFRHTRDTSPEIYGARFSPDGTILAVKSSAGIQIWNTAARAAVGTLSGGSSALAFSPDGATLASGSTRTDRANIKLWDLTDRTLIATLPGHTGGPTGVHSVAFSPSGDTLASGSGDRTIKLWDVANESLIATLTGHTSHVFSVAWSSDGTLASGSRDGTVKLWDAASQTSTATLEGNTGRVLDVAFSPGGTLLASSTDGPMLLWNVAAGGDTVALQGHGEASFSADGTTLVTGARLGEIVLWDVATAKSIARLGHPDRLKDASGFGINGVFSPDGSLLASVGLNGIELWDASEWTAAAPVTPAPAHPDSAGLAALYKATNGSGWRDKTNWLSGRPMGEWKGVRTNNLGRVYDLSLEGNQLSGTIPAELGNLTFLSSLYLYSNQLSGAIPAEFGNLSNLTQLEINHNRLSGGIPSELGSLSELTNLRLHSNQLSGQIPSELGNLTNLTILGLSDNQLTGSIPTELGNLTNLTSLGLSGNQLTGSIPAELGNLTNLTSLGLSSNQLTGSIPAEMGNLTNLTRLWLSNNQLTGSIPAELGNLTNLTHLYLAGNQLTGCIPAGLRDVANNDLDTLGLSDCGQTQTQAATDFNGDGSTDFADFFKFIDAYGTTDARYDLDGNGTVDFADFFMFVDAFDQPGQGTKLVAMAREMLGLPAGPELHQSSPNPFNSETVISWFLLEPGPARVEVFSLTGQRLAVLRQGRQEAGFHRLNWDGRDHEGRPLGSGVYLYRLVAGETVLTRKLTLLR